MNEYYINENKEYGHFRLLSNSNPVDLYVLYYPFIYPNKNDYMPITKIYFRWNIYNVK